MGQDAFQGLCCYHPTGKVRLVQTGSGTSYNTNRCTLFLEEDDVSWSVTKWAMLILRPAVEHLYEDQIKELVISFTGTGKVVYGPVRFKKVFLPNCGGGM